ncbi:hypothetical protein CDD81_4566 [Ophiocordyceps australis]|uniref:RCC1-like domain-containing protein n=1 Tax=Ophiocordyceps australis TaxID=1399860 RepID=A0A2C5YC86_9HYPO|nr:hypothetical protein CDD81_4566 [Ophiocordyceps australis]
MPTRAATRATKATKPATERALKAAATRAANAAAKTQPAAAASRKRKAQDEDETDTKPNGIEKDNKSTATSLTRASKAPRINIGKKINEAPTQILDVYVFGEGSSGELGLGSRRVNGKKPMDVKRPRLNDKLSAKSVGVVQVACGGMHAVALTHDNQILTWGVNDQGALGRDTTWEGKLVEADDDGDTVMDVDEDEDDTGINPRESTPTTISLDCFAPGTVFVQVVASDSATFALTEDGRVYGWGTFRSSDGVLGFDQSIKIQNTPILLPTLKNIKTLAAGANHILALDHKGSVVAWGCGQQNQLGRRIIERNKLSSLTPQGVGLPRGKIVKIACGSYHSFALDTTGNVWGWGLNNFGELGVMSNAGEDGAVILKPVKVSGLSDHHIVDIDGGVHHSLACSKEGKVLTWGRLDGYQVGFEFDQIDHDCIMHDSRGDPRILAVPCVLDIQNVASVAAGSDNSFAVTHDGKVYSWGFSANFQTGQGTFEDIHTPTLIDNTAIRGKQIIAAHAGGQFSMLAGVAEDSPATNGA